MIIIQIIMMIIMIIIMIIIVIIATSLFSLEGPGARCGRGGGGARQRAREGASTYVTY